MKPKHDTTLPQSAIEAGKLTYWHRTDAENLAIYYRNLREFDKEVAEAMEQDRARKARRDGV